MRGGVFDEAEEASRQTVETSHRHRIDDRIRWLTFYLIYTDDELSRYAPGGAMGARFDLFQFAGFPGSATLRLSHSHHRQDTHVPR